MTVRTYTQKDGTIWEWDETPELVEYIKNLHSSHGNINTGEQSTPQAQ
jgi:hypothetical protein